MHPIVTFRMRNNRTPVVKNEMRTVDIAKRNETYGTDTGQIRDDSDFKKTATHDGWRWGIKGLFLHAQEYYSVLTSLVAFIVN